MSIYLRINLLVLVISISIEATTESKRRALRYNSNSDSNSNSNDNINADNIIAGGAVYRSGREAELCPISSRIHTAVDMTHTYPYPIDIFPPSFVSVLFLFPPCLVLSQRLYHIQLFIYWVQADPPPLPLPLLLPYHFLHSRYSFLSIQREACVWFYLLLL